MNKLMKISRENLKVLRQLYRSSADRSSTSTTVNVITNVLNRIRKTPVLKKRVEFLSLNDNWRRNGTFLIKNESRVYFCTLEAAPYRSLRSTLDALDFESEITFVCISDKFRDILDDFVWYNGLEKFFEEGTSGYFMAKEDARSLETGSLPDSFIIKPLTTSYVDTINKESPRAGGDDLNYVRNSIEQKTSLGVFDKHTNELIAWCFEMDYCSIGMGVVRSTDQRTGIGSFVVKSLIKKIAVENDMDITFHVVHGHRISHRFCHYIGGRIFDTFTWISARRRVIKGPSKSGIYQLIY